MILDLDNMLANRSVPPNRRGRLWSAFLCLALIGGESSCAAWHARQDRLARKRDYEAQLASLHFPTTRKELYRALLPTGKSVHNLLIDTPFTDIERYPLDADFMVSATILPKRPTEMIDALITGRTSLKSSSPEDPVVNAYVIRMKHP
jgi:hypothetical protein